MAKASRSWKFFQCLMPPKHNSTTSGRLSSPAWDSSPIPTIFSASLSSPNSSAAFTTYTVPGSPKPGSLPPNVAAAVNGVALCGTLAGQLFFGYLGDKLGRKCVYGITLILIVGCSICSGLSFGSTPNSVMATLCFFRFWLGFGIGG
ncbi:hypothetical protein ACLB2K_019212 [Fragaria x ananassa]